MSCYPPTTHRWEREGATDWLRCKRCRDRKYDGIGPSIAPAVERADIPLETYWTDRTAALAEATLYSINKNGLTTPAEIIAKDALLYLREHGWTLEREERT